MIINRFNCITDKFGRQHKIREYDQQHGVYTIIDQKIEQGITRAIMGYEPQKQQFVLILHNLEQDTIRRINHFYPWDPQVYQGWDSENE